MLRTSDLDYSLPEDLIATQPASPRESARLLVVPRAATSAAPPAAAPSLSSSARVSDLRSLLRPGDVLVFNITRVIPARLLATRLDTGGHLEGLYLSPGSAPDEWIVLLRGNNPRPGLQLALLDEHAHESGLVLDIRSPGPEEGSWRVGVRWLGAGPERAALGATLNALEAAGHVPLPPYILKARQRRGQSFSEADDRAAYQTVFAHADFPGSVAAPTAGLHFTPTLLEDLDERGIERVNVVLHVGTGTFRPVDTDIVEDHPIHSEWCAMSADAVRAVLRARAEHRRVIAVGTTTARTLETYAALLAQRLGPGALHPTPADLASPDFTAALAHLPSHVSTDLLITPGYRWLWTDALLTNFHLPRSTLLAMVGSLLGPDESGVARLKALYDSAVAQRWRFYSFGDAMLIA